MNIPTGITNCKANDDSAIASDIPTKTIGNAANIFQSLTGSIFAFFNPTNRLPIPNATAPNIAAINIAVNNLNIPTGITNCKAYDESAIATDIATMTSGSAANIFQSLTGSIFAFLRPIRNFPIPYDTTANIPAIIIAVNSLDIPTGITIDNMYDDNVIAIAIATETKTRFFISAGLRSFILAIFSNAIATNGKAIANAITDRKLTSPINLNAKPIAKTPTAIIIIDANPSFNLDFCFGSLALSNGVSFSAGPFLSGPFLLNAIKVS